MESVTKKEFTQAVEHLDKRFDTVDGRLDVIDKRFADVGRRFAGVDRRFDAIDKRFVVVDQRFDAIESRLAATTVRLEHKIEEEVSGLAAMITKGFADLEKRLDVKDRVDVLEGKVAKIESALNVRL